MFNSLKASLEEIDKRLEDWKISDAEARLLKVLNVIWTNPIISFKTLSKWNQIAIVAIAEKVEWSQYSLLWWKAKDVMKKQFNLLWYEKADFVWENQVQFFWWYQNADKVKWDQIQWLPAFAISWWYQNANYVWWNQIQWDSIFVWYYGWYGAFNILNIWVQKAEKVEWKQEQFWFLDFWVQLADSVKEQNQCWLWIGYRKANEIREKDIDMSMVLNLKSVIDYIRKNLSTYFNKQVV